VIVCAIHFTHPSYTDLFDDVVKAEGLANHLEEPPRSVILGRTLKQVNADFRTRTSAGFSHQTRCLHAAIS